MTALRVLGVKPAPQGQGSRRAASQSSLPQNGLGIEEKIITNVNTGIKTQRFS